MRCIWRINLAQWLKQRHTNCWNRSHQKTRLASALKLYQYTTQDEIIESKAFNSYMSYDKTRYIYRWTDETFNRPILKLLKAIIKGTIVIGIWRSISPGLHSRNHPIGLSDVSCESVLAEIDEHGIFLVQICTIGDNALR